MSTFYAAQYKNENPTLPEGVGFLALVGSNASTWTVFECDQKISDVDGVKELPETLRDLLWDALKYPPALALAREYIDYDNYYYGKKRIGFDELVVLYEEQLRYYLRQQINDTYRLLEAVEPGETGYITPNGFYWVLDSQPKSMKTGVRWVSDDFFVYMNPAFYFKWV